MIAKSYINSTLNSLKSKFGRTSNQKDALLYSKLAIIELCGWIEISMDDLVLRCGRKKIKTSSNLKYFEEQIVEKTYGFEYKKDFKKMLVYVVGISGFELIESKADPVKLQKLKSQLGNLKKPRNTGAHTYLKSIAISIDAPSLTIQRFKEIYEGLKDIERVLKQANFI